MSKIQQFAPNSFFEQVDATHFKITIRQPIWKSFLNLFAGFITMFLPILIHDFENNPNFKYLWYLSSGLFLLFGLYNMLYYQKITFNTNKNYLVKRKSFAGITLKTINIKWPLDSYYLNENVFDSYQRITSVWMKAKSEESKNSKRLIEFSSQDQYLGFIKVLKESFPTLQIRDWHD